MATIDQMIEKYIQLRDYVAAEEAALKERLKNHRAAMETLEGAVSQTMGALDSAKCEFGTAYRTQTMAVRVADKGLFLDYVRLHGKYDLLDVHASKSTVKEMIEADNKPPPGVDVTFLQNVRFRRS